jgi:DSF synthase
MKSMSVNITPVEERNAFTHLDVSWDASAATLWCRMQPHPRPCFTPQLLAEISRLPNRFDQLGLESDNLSSSPHFIVFASAIPGVFNLGGDLGLFAALIEQRDRDGLSRYASACITASYAVSSGYDMPFTTISLVQGTALGGGMEGALAANVIIAERGTQLGLPEVLFNLFPGMGAYSFLSRRLGPSEAERIILSGKTWHAEELHDLGLIDILAERGLGETAARQYIAQRRKQSPNTLMALQQVRRLCNPVTREELDAIAEVWVEAALRLRPRDLRMMHRLARSQDRLVERRDGLQADRPDRSHPRSVA